MKQRLSLLVLTWLRFWARLQLRKISPDIVGITGSAGKTSTMEAVYAVLRDKYVTRKTDKANSATGIPLHILGLSMQTYSLSDWLRVCVLAPWRFLIDWTPYEKYIVEMGIDGPYEPNNMESLLQIVRPRTGILLNVALMHSEPFDALIPPGVKTEERVARVTALIANEKGKMIHQLPENGLAILNGDQDEVAQLASHAGAPTMTFGVTKGMDVHLAKVERSLAGTTFTYVYNGERAKLECSNQLLPDHYGMSFAAALCVAIDEDFTLDEGIELLEKHFVVPPGRSSLIPGKKGTFILDSSYNASARPFIDSIAMLAALKPPRLVVLMGDMRELGAESKVEHERVAQVLADEADIVYLVGPATQQYVQPYLIKAGVDEARVRWFSNARDASNALLTQLTTADMVLVKGSQNELLLEIAVEILMRRPEDAEKLLCRRGAYWDQRRARLLDAKL